MDKLMPYARLDDRYDDHRKIKRALRREPAAVAMHVMAITYCNRHNTDGEIDVEWVEEKLALMPCKPAQRQRVLAVLLEIPLFERRDKDTFFVHDFLDWNLSREQRTRLAKQGKRGGQARANGESPGKPPPSPGLSQGLSEGLSQDDSKGSSQGLSEGSSPPDASGLSTPFATPRHATPRKENSNAELRSAVIECFAYWQDRCGHQQAQLTADRRGKIEARLRERAKLGGGIRQAIADVRLAIDGAAHAPFVDDAGKRFDDVELICRKGSKLEDFMGRATLPATNVTPINRRPNADELIRKLKQAEESS
jgi:hypothetical protein